MEWRETEREREREGEGEMESEIERERERGDRKRQTFRTSISSAFLATKIGVPASVFSRSLAVIFTP